MRSYITQAVIERELHSVRLSQPDEAWQNAITPIRQELEDLLADMAMVDLSPVPDLPTDLSELVNGEQDVWASGWGEL